LPALVEAKVDGEHLMLYPVDGTLAVLAMPPLFARGYRYGDLVQTAYEDGELMVRRIVRAGTARSWRFSHALDNDLLLALIDRCQWLGAAVRATAREIVVAVPHAYPVRPVIEALCDAGITAARGPLEELLQTEAVGGVA
jgi:hypothetical protein